jgi:hypothetical protein
MNNFRYFLTALIALVLSSCVYFLGPCCEQGIDISLSKSTVSSSHKSNAALNVHRHLLTL